MKLSLVTSIKNRSASTSKDARMVNAFAEIKNGVARAVKRPSLVDTFAELEAGAGNGQGLFSFSTPDGTQTLVGIQNDVVNNSPTPKVTTLRFVAQPSDWKIATAMSPSVTVRATDSFGATITSYTGTVTISFADNPNGGTLSGTLSVAAISGVATFSNLKIDKVGGGYTLRATASLMRRATSNSFKIISTLSFTTQPVDTPVSNTMATVRVSALDAASAVITAYTGNVTLVAASGTGTLSGTLTVAAVAGVATFTDLAIDAGGFYVLVASETNGGMANVTSNTFAISNYSLVAGTDTVMGQTIFGYSNTTLIWPNVVGSISPTTYNGVTIRGYASNPAVPTTAFAVTGNVAQTFFTSITANSVTLLSAAATGYLYDPTTDTTTWVWGATGTFNATGTFPVTLA